MTAGRPFGIFRHSARPPPLFSVASTAICHKQRAGSRAFCAAPRIWPRHALRAAISRIHTRRNTIGSTRCLLATLVCDAAGHLLMTGKVAMIRAMTSRVYRAAETLLSSPREGERGLVEKFVSERPKVLSNGEIADFGFIGFIGSHSTPANEFVSFDRADRLFRVRRTRKPRRVNPNDYRRVCVVFSDRVFSRFRDLSDRSVRRFSSRMYSFP